MRKNIAKLMAIRMGVYVLLVGYLACDLFVFKGPISKSLNESSRDEKTAIAEAKASGVVARVYYRPIFRAQVEESIKEYLWRRGRTVAETSAGERKVLRLLIVNQLIDDELVKLQIKVSTAEEVAVDEEQIEQALALEVQRYPDEKVFESLADRAKWSGEKKLRKKERRSRLAARIQRGEHLERMIEISVSEAEMSAWFTENKDALSGGDESTEAAIRDALLSMKRDEGWQKFRVARLRRWAEGKIDLFEDVLYAEEGE